jgi:RND family efflux transporter MFP subunit
MPGTIVRLNVVAGNEVSAGQVLAEIENDAMKAQLADLKTSYELAKDVYNKQKALWDQKIGTEMQYIQAKSNKESMEQKIKQLNETIDMYYIKAPFSGTVDEVSIKLGQTVAPGVPAVRIVNFNKLKVKADLAEAYSARVKAGNVINLYFPDIDKSETTKVIYNGKVINALTRTFTVEAMLPSKEEYRPNMVAEVHIVDYTKNDAMVVPVNTIQNIDDKNYVFVAADEKGKKVARKREVSVGETYNGAAEIKTGMQSGDLLITTGYSNLNDGELIRF